MLTLSEFDRAVEKVNNVYTRHNREELVRTATASQGDAKAIKTALAHLRRKGERDPNVKTAKEFLHFNGGLGRS